MSNAKVFSSKDVSSGVFNGGVTVSKATFQEPVYFVDGVLVRAVD